MSDWIVEAVIQFVRSPMWTTPVQNFIDGYCMIFDNEEELKLEYTAIHQQFRALIEDVLESFLSELGISPETMLAACEANRAKEPRVAKFLQYLLTLDDFRAFRKIMVKRNVELETEAMEAWAKVQAQHAADLAAAAEPSPPPSQPSSQSKTTLSSPSKEADDEELQLALTASLRASEMIMKQAELEDAELQAALALSIAEEEERMRKEQRRLEEERERKAEEERLLHAQMDIAERQKAEASAEKRKVLEKAQHEMEMEQMRKEAELKKKELEVQALEQRVRNIAMASAEANKAEAEGRHASAVPPKVVVPPEEAGPVVLKAEAPAASASSQPPAANPAPSSASSRPPAATPASAPSASAAQPAKSSPSATSTASTPAEVVHVSLTKAETEAAAVEAKRSERSLGELKQRGGGFAKYGALPSLSFGELKSEFKPESTKSDNPELSGTLKSKAQLAEEEAQSRAEVEARAKYMREQKEKLIAQKSKERGEAMAQYAHQNGLAVPAASSAPPSGPAPAGSPAVDDEHRQMTRALLRRFKDDIIRESSKQQP